MKPVIVLDMDETLLHTPDDQFVFGKPIKPIPRPGLHAFIEIVNQMGEVWILSAGTPAYVKEALTRVGIIGKVQGYRSSRMHNNLGDNVIKGRPWVLVDDRDANSEFTKTKIKQCLGKYEEFKPEKLIQVMIFNGDKSDRVLEGLPGLIGLSLSIQAGKE